MASIRIKEVTDSNEGGPSVVFVTEDGRRFDLQNEEEQKKLHKLLAEQKAESK